MVFKKHHRPSKAKSTGVVLVIVMIFMLALSAIAIFSARNAMLGERQARNELEYQVARQAAESALRDAERDLRLDSLTTPGGAVCTRGGVLRTEDSVISDDEFTDTCLRGQCKLPAARYSVGWASATTATGSSPGEPWWPASKGGAWSNAVVTAAGCETFTGGVPLGLFTGAPPLAGVVQQPQYLIEYLSPAQDFGAELKTFDCPTPLLVTSAAGVATADAGSAVAATQTLNMPCHLFRITARGFGPTVNAQVVMQTYFHILKY